MTDLERAATERADKAEAACAQLREALEVVRDTVSWRSGTLFRPGFVQLGRTRPAATDEVLRATVDAALSASPGGWLEARISEAVEVERDSIKSLILGGSFLTNDSPAARFAREVVAAIDRDAESRARKTEAARHG